MNDTQEITRSSDIGTPELHRQYAGAVENKVTADGQRRAYVRAQVPLDYYLAYKWVNETQHSAGNEFYRLWYYGAEKSPYVTCRIDQVPGKRDFETAAILEEKYRNAERSINGLMPKIITYNVCCIGEWAAAVKTALGVNRRMIILRSGLDDLARHFGF